MFRDRDDAARQLAARLQGRALHNPLVLGIPRGGVAVASILAQELEAEMDVVLSRKLRAPGHAELAIGAVAEDGQVHLDHGLIKWLGLSREYILSEIDQQREEIARRSRLFRQVRPPAPITGRSVIVTDDGLATGATMMAALRSLRPQNPRELLVAVPVASPDRLPELRRWCNDVICVLAPSHFAAVSQFYATFTQVSDEEVLQLLHLANLRAREATHIG
jgi:hypothetical protein